jgi:sulfate adenylyltransferase subunit 2
MRNHRRSASVKSRLQTLEAESIEILREIAHESVSTVILYSAGKDSSALLHLAQKAFYPGTIPFTVMHIDTGFKFEEMYEFRDRRLREIGVSFLVERNENAIARKSNPFALGTSVCCSLLKTDALLGALRKRDFKIAIGGARRDEEKSRAKERVFSVRSRDAGWDPKKQRVEFANIYNTRLAEGESMRIFPLSNWTELDIWNYIEQEKIDIVPLYFAKKRPVVRRNGQLIPYFDGLSLKEGETVEETLCRFRTLGCWPCTGAIESNASSIQEIISELTGISVSERSTRVIDHDEPSSMEKKKREGYF